MSRRHSRFVVAAAAAAAAAALAAPAAHATTTVVAKGIDNPRGLALAPDGTLYVASAGKGGKQACHKDPEEGSTDCFGTSSKILAIKNGTTTTVASGLMSVAGTDGTFATGADDVSVAPDGSIEAIETSGTKQQVKTAPAFAQAQAGGLFQVAPGPLTKLAGVSQLEWSTNIDGVKGDENSDPYGVLALAGHTLVADAGANAVLNVTGGVTAVYSVIPPNGKAQAVPTALAQAPDGSVYVGELAFGAGPGKARIWKLPAGGGAPIPFATGFTAIDGLAFAPDGTMYVTELSLNIEKNKPGAVVKVAPDGTRTVVSDPGILFPAGAAADATGVYVSTFSTLPGTTSKKSPFHGAGGEVVRITG